ncbi:MAG: STM3941 family protein [Chitinophagaceae bacterium]
MSTTIQFKYNKGFAYIMTIVLLLLCIVFILNAYFIKVNTVKSALLFSGFMPFLFLFYLRKRFFLPALKNEPALELNNNEIIYFIKNQSVPWSNVKSIRQLTFKNSLGIAVVLVDKNEFMQDKTALQKAGYFFSNLFYGTPIVISLQYIAGKDKDILQTVQKYFEEKQASAGKNTSRL